MKPKQLLQQSEIRGSVSTIAPAIVLATGVWAIFFFGTVTQEPPGVGVTTARLFSSMPEVYAAGIEPRLRLEAVHEAYSIVDREVGSHAREATNSSDD